MKKYSKITAIIFVFAIALLITGCGKKVNYDDYRGFQFAGKNPWNDELAITIRTIENDKVTWTYTDVFGDDDDAIMAYQEVTSEIKDGKISFNLKGDTDTTNITYEYSGTITFEDGKLVVKYEKGQLTSNASEGGSGSFQVGALEENNKTVTLTKVEDKS